MVRLPGPGPRLFCVESCGVVTTRRFKGFWGFDLKFLFETWTDEQMVFDASLLII